MIEAVVFDWGGTLTPIHEVDPVEVWRAAAGLLTTERREQLAVALSAAQDDVWSSTMDSLRSGQVAEIVAAAMAACELPASSEETVAAAVAAYLEEWVPYSVAHPEAAGVLRTLRDRGLRTGLLSNTHWPAYWHEQRLAADGLTGLLDARVYTSDLEYRKPHPTAFAAVLATLGVAPENAVFVGDRLHDDVYGAGAVGMRTIWIRNGSWLGWDVEPDALVDELAGVVGVIDRWTGRAAAPP